MTTALTTFEFQSNAIRVVTIEDKPWFVAADVCRALDFYMQRGKALVTAPLRPLLPDEKGKCLLLTPGGSQHVVVISESGLYKLVMRAQRTNSAARQFQDWVTRDVLPAIRKDGLYVMGEEKGSRTPPLPDTLGPPRKAPAVSALPAPGFASEEPRGALHMVVPDPSESRRPYHLPTALTAGVEPEVVPYEEEGTGFDRKREGKDTDGHKRCPIGLMAVALCNGSI